MATVFLASHPERGLVALKLTHPHLRQQVDRARELVTEARIAAGVRHPNVAAVFHADEDTNGVYLVMEYVEGDTLAGLLRREERMPLGIALGILCGALDGLHAAHEREGGIVHRDFSPHNILVGIDGVARLTDFGIAKSRDSDVVTESGVVKGKFGYMAPEQLRGREIDRRADVWAAGVVAWELCTGRRLFDASDQVANMLRLVTEKPGRATSVVPDLPSALDDAIAGALEIDVRRRCGSARELADAIRASAPIASVEAIGAFVRRVSKDLLAERAARIVRTKKRSRGWLVAGALVASGAAIAGAVVWKRPAPIASSAAVAPSSTPTLVSAESPVIAAPPLPAPVVASAAPSATTRPRPRFLERGARGEPSAFAGEHPTGKAHVKTKSSTARGNLLDNPYKTE